MPSIQADKEPQVYIVRTGPWDLAKNDDVEKISYQTKKENKHEKKSDSVSSEYGMDTDRDTGDVNDAV